MLSRRRPFGWLALVAVCTLTACTSSPSSSGQLATVLVTSQNLQFLTAESSDSEPEAQAAFEGNLTVDDSACLGLVVDEQTIGVVFPAGTTVTDDESSVILPDNSRLSTGGHVSLGGGYYPRERLSTGDPENACKYSEYFVVGSL